MRWSITFGSFVMALVVSMSFGPLPAALAQADEASAPEPKQALEDYIHFVKVANDAVATALAQDLLSRGLTGEQFVNLVDDARQTARFIEAVEAGVRRNDAPELRELSAELRALYEGGRLDIARNPNQIQDNIDGLTGNLRARRLANERLIFAGEYAMPQLLEALLQREDPELRASASRVMVHLGPQAVMPLVETLSKLDPGRQELVVSVLGKIPYKSSLPMLRELAETSPDDSVRQAATRAVNQIDSSAGSRQPSDLYRALAEAYFDEREDLTSFPSEEFQLLWNYDPGVGLIPMPLRTEVYHEAMAMRSAERAIKLGAGDGEALSLWVAANWSREIDTPAGYQNPAWPADNRGADYFGVASGVEVAQRVLARAIEDRDTQLARRAIAALERTAGAGQLWARLGDRRPLLDALLYPSRRVQYEAALALGKAQPTKSFDGAERVVPMLASAVRDATSSHAAIFTRDTDRYQTLRRVLEAQGFEVLPMGAAPTDIANALTQVAAVDLAVIDRSSERARELVSEMRADPKLAATPALLLMDPEGYARLRRIFERDPSTEARTRGIDDAQLAASVRALLERASGGAIDARDAGDYRRRALEVLRDIALARGGVYGIEDAAPALTAALGASTGGTKLSIAEVLSRISSPGAQVALLDMALAEAPGSIERIELLNRVADSAKRFGRQVNDRQIDRLLDVAADADGPAATAAAAAVGAMNLDNARLLRLIDAQ
ncbi:MAG: HEAT repeat domain-containing protein [Planctomycetota bacterium]